MAGLATARNNRSGACCVPAVRSNIVNVSRGAVCGLAVVGLVLMADRGTELGAQTPQRSAAIVGGWTLNRDLSDQPAEARPDAQPGDNTGGGRHGDGGRYGGGGGRHRGGGFGGGQRGGSAPNPEDMARTREAMRDLMTPPQHLIVADTGSMIVMTGPDGRALRLSPDGKKIKDDNTKVERKTKWDGDKLVSEINGVGPNKIVQTFSADPERHQLHVTVQIENNRTGQPRIMTQVYDADPK
jgi:hypothetical protein